MAGHKSAAKSSSSNRAGGHRLSADEREAQERAKHAPVGFGSGESLDREKLHKGLEDVVDAQPHNRDAEVRKALEDAREDTVRTDTESPNALPGHKVMETKTRLAPGTIVEGKEVGGTVVTERRQVYDPTTADKPETSELAVGDGGQAVIGGQSAVLSMDDVDEEATDYVETDTGSESSSSDDA